MREINQFAWVRTRVAPPIKQAVRDAALELGWTIPGVEAAAIAFVFTAYTGPEFADVIRRALAGEELEDTERSDV